MLQLIGDSCNNVWPPIGPNYGTLESPQGQSHPLAPTLAPWDRHRARHPS